MKITVQTGQGQPAILEDNDRSEFTITENKQTHRRAKRNDLLAQSDMYVLPDIGLSESKVTEWKTYRQALRDMDFSDPDNLTWPTKP